MSKSVLILETPTCCELCRFIDYEPKCHCRMLSYKEAKIEDRFTKLKNCPLRKLPEQKNKTIVHPVHLDIDSKIPSYTEGKKRLCKKKIQAIMHEYEYDEDDIKNIDDNFCQGFGVAKDIIYTFLKEKSEVKL